MKKLYISVLMLLMLSFAASTATYAWLGLATTNTVKDISLTTYLGNELEISLDGINYYQNLPSDLMMELVGDVVLKDITSNDGKTFSFGLREKAGIPKKNHDYISMDFYFRTTSVFAHYVYLSNNTTLMSTYDFPLKGSYVVSQGRNWISDISFQYSKDKMMNKGDSGKFYISDAMRVSFIEHRLNEQDERTNLSQKIFDLSGNEERGFGKAYGAHDYYNKIKSFVAVPSLIPNTVYEFSEFSTTGPFAFDKRSEILTLIKTDQKDLNGMSYYKGRLTMNIWVEGWDADLFDAVFGDLVKMQFEFKAVHGIKA